MSTIEPNIEGYGSPIYSVSPDSQTNARISAVLNEAAHVFNWHAEGLWKTECRAPALEGFSLENTQKRCTLESDNSMLDARELFKGEQN